MTEPDFTTDFEKYCRIRSTPEVLSEMIGNFEEYLSSIIININSDIFEKMYNNNSDAVSDYSFKTLKKNLEKYMDIICNKFIKMFIDHNSTDIYAKFIELLIMATIKLYEFIYIINESKTIPVNTFNSNHATSNFFKFIITKYFEQISSFLEREMKVDITELYRYLMHNTQISFFSDDYIILNKYINYIKKIIDMNNRSTNYIDNYITIPQYEGICWFTSFLTGICYSDKNKQLLKEKFNKNEAKYKNITINIDDEQDPEILLTSFVYNVIFLITSEFKKYSDYNDDDECLIHLYLKKMPHRILIAFYNYYLEQDKSDIPEYFKTLHNNHNNIRLSYNDVIKNPGLYLPYTNEIYIIFYKCLNINVLILFLINDILYIKTRDEETYLKTDYDIIIYQTVTNIYYDLFDRLYQLKNIATLKFPIDYIEQKVNTIQFDKDTYDLDFITHTSDETNQCSFNEGCSHCITAIQYNDEQYFHDTANLRYGATKTCESDTINITCKFINYNWLDNIHNPHYLYTINKCNLIQISNISKIYNIIKEYNSGVLYYSMTKNAMLIFIKNSKKQKRGGNKKNKYLINNIKNNHYIYINEKKIKLNIENAKIYILLYNKKVFLNKKHFSIKDDKYYITI